MIHFEDQLASEKKCGYMGGKVLVPTQTMIKNLKSAEISCRCNGSSINYFSKN